MTVVGHFVGFQMGYKDIVGHLKRMWILYQLDEVIVNQGYYYCNFKSYEGKKSMIEKEHWLVNNLPLFVRKWKPGLCMSKPDTSKVLVWVKIFDIPLEAWNAEGISRIVSSIGVPIIMDKVTTSICEKPYGRASFAKVLVEVDAAKGLVDSVKVWYRSLGKSMFLDVEYIWKPPLCEFCKTFGHFTKGCSKKAKEDIVKNASSGGNDNSGVGVGFGYANSDGEGWQNMGSVDEVLVTNEVEEVVKGKDVVNERKGCNTGNDTTESEMKEASVKASVVREKDYVAFMEFDVKNRFDAIEGENDDMDVTDWKDINLIQVNRNRFNNAKSNATRMVKEPEAKTEESKAEVEFFLLSNKPLTEDLYKAWTEDMMEYYFGRCDEIRSDRINGHFEDKDDERLNNQVEVEEVNTGSAEEENIGMCAVVETQDSNVIGADLISQSDQVMHFTLNFVHDHRKQFVSFVYAHNLERDRKPLWENLKDHNKVVNGGSWVILGDFNAMLNSEDCCNSFSVRDKDMDDFRRCLEALDLEDIANHCPIVLVYPETKVHKPRVNGNVFNKVKVLRAKLKKVQQILDKDPNSVHLREEELVYNNAYRESMVDGEKVYKQKTEVEWLKEGDQNTAYFHKVLKGRVNKCRIEMVYDDEGNKFEGDDVPVKFMTHFQKFLGNKDVVFPMEDVEGLFIKKLDLLCAESIVVGDDVCAAVKEFFMSGKLLGEFNANLISLIPKIQTPLRVSDYRPISCCNIIYKCISKVVTNRMKEGLGNYIDSNQSAFISGRQISNNILLMQEFMRDYDLEKGASRCAFKIDIQNAYDTVNWDFLKISLVHFGFHTSMIHWIMGKRGLRQGDPISPYLFTVVMEVFNLMVKRQSRLDSRKALDEFTLSSGLYLSMPKSSGFFRCVPDDVKAQINLVMPFRDGELPMRYLGILMTCRKICNDDCRILIENDSGKGIASVAWKDVCKPKSHGGLVLKPLKTMNEALMIKHLWNVILKLRNKVINNVGYRIGNRKGCFVWFDRWHSNGPLSKFIDRNFIKFHGLNVKDKVADWIGSNNKWIWPDDLGDRFNEVTNVPVQDKVMARLDDLSNIWAEERNFRLFQKVERTSDIVFKLTVETVRLKLLGLKINHSLEVEKAAKMWNLPLKGIKGVGRGTIWSKDRFDGLEVCLEMSTFLSHSQVSYHPVVITMIDGVGFHHGWTWYIVELF
nr:hypothetical protein [Tanacetum cinerariifolium]